MFFPVFPIEEQFHFRAWNEKRAGDSNEDWILVQHRNLDEIEGDSDFFQEATWKDYKNGFGEPEGTYWMGLERMHEMTSTGTWQLMLIARAGNVASSFNYIIYNNFKIGSELMEYPLTVENVGGTRGEWQSATEDELMYFNDMEFSTPDKDNDRDYNHCAQQNPSGWWFKHCYFFDLNGKKNQYGIFNSGSVLGSASVSQTKMAMRQV